MGTLASCDWLGLGIFAALAWTLRLHSSVMHEYVVKPLLRLYDVDKVHSAIRLDHPAFVESQVCPGLWWILEGGTTIRRKDQTAAESCVLFRRAPKRIECFGKVLYRGGAFDDCSLVVQIVINLSREIALLRRNADSLLKQVWLQ